MGRRMRDSSYGKAVQGLRQRNMQRLSIAGFGFFEAWFLLVFIGGGLYGNDDVHLPFWARMVVLIALAVGFLLYRVVVPACREERIMRLMVAGGGACASLASAILVIAPIVHPSSQAVLSFCAVVAGVSMAVVLIVGAETWMRLTSDVIGLCLSVSLVLACVIFLIGMVIPPLCSGVLCAVLPLLCGLTLALPSSGTVISPCRTSLFDLSRYAQRICLFLGLFYFVFGLAWEVLASRDSLTSAQDGAVIAVVLLAFSAFLIAGGVKKPFDEVAIALYRCYLPCFIAAFVGASALPMYDIGVRAALAVGFMVLDNLVWLLQPSVRLRSQSDGAIIGSLTRFICYGMLGVGFLMGFLVEEFFAGSPIAFGCVLMVCAIAVTVAQTIVLPESVALEIIESRRAMVANQSTVDNRCREIAEASGITARELEVMLLLAKGRSYAFIEEELVVSRNTIKSHANHIYRKTGTHSREELLKLIYEGEKA